MKVEKMKKMELTNEQNKGYVTSAFQPLVEYGYSYPIRPRNGTIVITYMEYPTN